MPQGLAIGLCFKFRLQTPTSLAVSVALHYRNDTGGLWPGEKDVHDDNIVGIKYLRLTHTT